MRKIITGLFIVVGLLQAKAQQSAQYTQYMVNPYLMNPALASADNRIDIKTGYRAQWVGFNQNEVAADQAGVNNTGQVVAPRTMYVSGHSPVGRPNSVMGYVTEATTWFGVGGKVMYDKTGPTSWGSYMVSGTYNMGIIKPKGSGKYTRGGLRMSVGAFVGVQQYSLDWNQLTFANDAGEPLRGANTGTVTEFMPDATLGLWIYNESFFIGLSGDHLFGNKIDIKSSLDRDKTGALARHAFLTTGIHQKITDELDWSPSVLLKFTPSAPLSVDINNKITYNKSYWAGLSYRHLDALSIAVGAVITDNYEVAYSYDFTTSDVRTYGGAAATHEITLGYRILPTPKSMNAEDHNHGHTGKKKHKKGVRRR